MTSISMNLFGVFAFTLAHLCFVYAVYKRLRLVFSAQAAGKLAPLEARLRSVLLHVVFQFKLFKRPMRGLMHAFIFYGFLAYLMHTASQMIAGNGWYFLQQAGVDPYSFRITDYMDLGLALGIGQSAFVLFGLLLAIALTVFAMYSLKLPKKSWKNSAGIQWFFLSLLSLESSAVFLLLITSGTHFYEAVVQHFSVFILISLLYFAYRRWVRRAKGLDVPSSQSAVVLFMIATLMLSTLFGTTAQVYMYEQDHIIWINSLIAKLLFFLGFDISATHQALALRDFSWWAHICTVYAFMIYIPLSKHSHLVFAPINYFLIKDRPWGQLKMMDLEAEDAVWGASHVGELSWTSLLDGLSCIECGRCTIVCPANRTAKALDPKKIMVDIKHSMLENQNALLASTSKQNAASAAPAALIGEPYITDEELWGCTSCHACVEACPVGNNQLDAIIDMRRNLVLSESRFPAELQTAFQNMENQSNPWGIGSHSRADWCSDMNVKKMADDSKVDVLYWAGCAASFDERNRKIARSFVSILQKAEVNFAILGTEENCTGDSARRSGNEYLYQSLAKQNIDTLNRYKVKKIVTACPHCYNTLQHEYPQMGGHYQVHHHTDFIDDLIRKKKIKMDEAKVESMQKRRSTYHDSCYLGRYNEIYDAPRNLAQKALGMAPSEAEDHHSNSLCCGAGGAQMWMEEKYERVNNKRTQQLVDTGADTIATACPFCITMISDGVKGKELQDEVKVMDVAELVEANMEDSEKNLPEGFTARQDTGH